MEWIGQTFTWYLYLLLIGTIFIPVTKRFFPTFFDFGYSFSKTIAIITLTYSVFILGILHILPFNQLNLILITIMFGVASCYLYINDKSAIEINRNKILIFIGEELLFLVALFFLAYIRGQEPSIRGLEKFMDFGFMNSILKSQYFPPLDMWLSADPSRPNGYPINYYYFGHLTGAFLIKLSGLVPTVGYNLILATIFAQAITSVFSISANTVYIVQKYVLKRGIHKPSILSIGALGSIIVNFGGNLHTVYVFTKGYQNENPVPFWEILSFYNPAKYWYPNATRFIPYTIHEFPAYSYVVADLHGHVFDIPFVLLTFALLFSVFSQSHTFEIPKKMHSLKTAFFSFLNEKTNIITTILLGFLCSIHYMTNAFDGPIYLLLSSIFLFLMYKLTPRFGLHIGTLFTSFVVFSYPFSAFFSPFVSGIGVNCSPDFLVELHKVGPFLFEKGNCQLSPPWMLFILWGFFWVSLLIFVTILFLNRKYEQLAHFIKKETLDRLQTVDLFMLIIFAFGTFLVIIPEFFYIKDIYPMHFRANTMFKLGYQAFMMMGIASSYVFFRTRLLDRMSYFFLKAVFIFFFAFIFIYSFFAFPSYYGSLQQTPQLDGSRWIATTYPEDKEIIDYINSSIDGQPVILEAQGDSYTDFERISAYTGLPTIAGWWVHEWLWRGSSDIVGRRIPDVSTIYESDDLDKTTAAINKYHVKYVVISSQEKIKYKKLNEDKFLQIGRRIFTASNGRGALYQLNQY